MASSFLCINERASIQAAKHVLSSLNENDLFVDHLMAFVHKGRHLQVKEEIVYG
jgi:hypothetical protein